MPALVSAYCWRRLVVVDHHPTPNPVQESTGDHKDPFWKRQSAWTTGFWMSPSSSSSRVLYGVKFSLPPFVKPTGCNKPQPLYIRFWRIDNKICTSRFEFHRSPFSYAARDGCKQGDRGDNWVRVKRCGPKTLPLVA